MAEDVAEDLGEGFVHLRVRSAYSLLEGAIKADAIGALAEAADMPAVALTDRANLFGALEFSVATKDAGVQPIVGCALPVTGIGEGPPERWARTPDRRAAGPERAGLPATSPSCPRPPISRSTPTDEPHVPWAQGRRARRGADPALRRAGRAGRSAVRRRPQAKEGQRGAGRDAAGVRRPLLCRAAAPRPGRRGRRRAGAGGLRLRARRAAGRHQRRLLRRPPTMHQAHDALLCIADGAFVGQDERRRVTAEHWFKPPADMRAPVRRPAGGLRQHPRHRPALRLHGRQARSDPAALPHRRRPHARTRNWPHQAREGLKARLAINAAGRAARPTTEARLEREIGVITQMGFSGYFLIVSDFMKWAVAHGIPVGPGRGSGAGSLVAWSLTDHRPRPAALRPALRALPEPRAGVDARLRHRLLPGAARGGDRLRPGRATAATGWPRSSPSAPCRRARCCATSAGCCSCRWAWSTGWPRWCRTTRPTR